VPAEAQLGGRSAQSNCPRPSAALMLSPNLERAAGAVRSAFARPPSRLARLRWRPRSCRSAPEDRSATKEFVGSSGTRRARSREGTRRIRTRPAAPFARSTRRRSGHRTTAFGPRQLCGWPGKSRVPVTRLTRCPAWAAALCPRATRPRDGPACARRWTSSTGSARLRPATFPPTRSSRRFRDQPADVGVIAPAGGLADSPAQVRKLA
jgi:hypothetical protein